MALNNVLLWLIANIEEITRVPATARLQYIRRLFNHYAPHFDGSLGGRGNIVPSSPSLSPPLRDADAHFVEI